MTRNLIIIILCLTLLYSLYLNYRQGQVSTKAIELVDDFSKLQEETFCLIEKKLND